MNPLFGGLLRPLLTMVEYNYQIFLQDCRLLIFLIPWPWLCWGSFRHLRVSDFDCCYDDWQNLNDLQDLEIRMLTRTGYSSSVKVYVQLFKMGIWKPTIWILERFEYLTFWSSDCKWFSIQMVSLWIMSYILDRPWHLWTIWLPD